VKLRVRHGGDHLASAGSDATVDGLIAYSTVRIFKRGSLAREIVAVFFLSSAILFLLAYPLTVQLGHAVFPQGADTDLNLWLFGWDTYAAWHRPLSIFDGNIYHPQRFTLAYSENMIGSALLVSPIVWATGNVVLALNVSQLLSVPLCAAGAYVLARRIGLEARGALIAAMVFAFSTPRFFRIAQPHLTAVQWLPFCLAFLHQYFDTGRARELRWALAFFTLQALTSGHGGVLTALAVAMYLVWRFALGEPVTPLRRVRDIGLVGVLLLAVNIALMLPYRAVQQEMGLRRSLGEAVTFSPNRESFLATPSRIDAWLLGKLTGDPRMTDRAKAVLFPGFIPLALGAVGVLGIGRRPGRTAIKRDTRALRWLSWLLEAVLLVAVALAVTAFIAGPFRIRFGSIAMVSVRNLTRASLIVAAVAAARLALRRRVPLDLDGRVVRLALRVREWSRRRRGDALAFYVLLGIVSLWMALGPPFHLYTLVHDWPGFSFIRVPTRLTMLTVLAVAILAGAGLERITRARTKSWRTAATALCVALFVAESAAFPLITQPYAVEIPAVDRWLAAQSKPFVVAEVPDEEHWQSVYMLHSMAHWQKTIHGYSGMRPPLNQELYDALLDFPDTNSLTRLLDVGVTHLIVHTDYYAPEKWREVESKLPAFSDWLTLLHAEDGGRVYSLRRPTSIASTMR
jgi:hypothetical protein